jgi:NAD(P)H-dependent flavin oxidoreductase YrpB (nitropropane dioxygenase family)
VVARPSLRTPICALLGIDVPIVQAPIGRVGGSALAAAVSNAGGLGTLGLSYAEDAEIDSTLGSMGDLTDRPFGVNLILAQDQRHRLRSCLAAGVRIVSYFWSELAAGDPYIEEVHDAGGLVILTVGSADEGRRAVDAGVDVVVAQGLDAGGHVWGSVGTLALVPAVVDATRPTPVIAAGGIGDGRGVAAVLALGAQAAWMGTRFVVATESLAHVDYRRRVIDATETDAVWSTGVFDHGWQAPVRTLDNSTLRDWREAGSPPAGERPGEGAVVARRASGEPILRYEFVPPLVDMSGDLEAMANYAGQSVGVIHEERSAADIVRSVLAEAQEAFAGIARGEGAGA